jgi:hypothetical protein
MNVSRFIDNLREIKLDLGEGMLVNYGESYRQFAPFKINSLWLSIQASASHFCRPRQTIIDLNQYTHFEVGLFTKEEYARAKNHFPEFRSLAELEHYFNGLLYEAVPTDLVEEFYKYVLQVADKNGTI